MNRDDVERIIENKLAEFETRIFNELSLELQGGHFTDPNSRRIDLVYKYRVVASAYFDVVQKDEYMG